jgi:hypothetical protein
VVLLGPESAFDRSTSGVLEPAFPVFGARVRRVHAEPSWFASGSGRIVSTRPGFIQVIAEPTQDMVLRFHYDPRLECRPSCTAHSVALPGARSSFIGVENPPAEFELFLR